MKLLNTSNNSHLIIENFVLITYKALFSLKNDWNQNIKQSHYLYEMGKMSLLREDGT